MQNSPRICENEENISRQLMRMLKSQLHSDGHSSTREPSVNMYFALGLFYRKREKNSKSAVRR